MNRDYTESVLSDAIGAMLFATIDLQLYLDMHPGESEALRKFVEYQRKLEELEAQYVSRFGPLTSGDVSGNNGWTWGITPMPWEGGN